MTSLADNPKFKVAAIDPPDIEFFKAQSLHRMLELLPIIQIGEADTDNSQLHIKCRMPAIICKDGTWLSVQAGENYHCDPKNDVGPYTKVEVGYPSVEPPLMWREFAENAEDPTGTIYSNLPIEYVSFYIGSHGGIDLEKTFGSDFKFTVED